MDGGDIEGQDEHLAKLNADVEMSELRARYYEAQVRILEARRKLAELRKAKLPGA